MHTIQKNGLRVFVWTALVLFLSAGAHPSAGQAEKVFPSDTVHENLYWKSIARIKDITVKGAFPVFRKEVVDIMTIYTGDAFSNQKLAAQAPRIRELFLKKGYVDPTVSVTARKDEADGHFIVDVKIEKKEFFRVSSILFEGNAGFSSARLRMMTKTGNSFLLLTLSKRFVQRNVDEDKKKLIKFYRKKGFADVEVKTEIIKNLDAKTVEVKFILAEGFRYKIEFTGNTAFWDHTLKKDIVLFKEGNRHSFGLKKSIRNIRNRYVRKGYPDVKVKTTIMEKHESRPPVRKVLLIIDEGPPYRVSSVAVTGNRSISEQSIKKQVLEGPAGIFADSGFSEKGLEEDMDAIRALYLKEGYAETRIEKQVKIKELKPEKGVTEKSVEITLGIDEGVQTRVGTVGFQGLDLLTEEQALKMMSLAPGQPFRRYMIENDEGVLKKAVSEMGYPHVQVKTDIIVNRDRSLADLMFTVDKGPYVRVGQILYAGNFRTKDIVLNNEMELSPEDPLSLIKLLESRRNLSNMNALDSVRFKTPGLKEKKAEVDLLVEVAEKPPYVFEIEAGYDTRRHVYTGLTAGDHNFLGRNLDLEAGVEVSRIGYRSDFSLMEPRLFASRISSSIKAFVEKKEEFNQDFGTRTYGLSQEFSRTFLTDRLTVNLGVGIQSHEQYLTETGPLSTEDDEQYGARAIILAGPSVIYRTTDSYVRPRKGGLSTFSVEFSKGFDNTLDDFIKYRLDTRYYYTPFEPLTLAARCRYGLIQAYGETAIPEDQLFFLGGTSSVRGFEENLLRFDATGSAVGGREVLLGSLEARYDLGANLELTTFYDVGSVRQAEGGSGSDDFRASVGVGLRYMTPIGPIGLLYGMKLDPLPDESRGSVHFSMGYTF